MKQDSTEIKERISSQARINLEGSETIPKGSTPCETDGGSAHPLTCNDEGDDIVRRRNHFHELVHKKYGDQFTYNLSEYKTAKTKIKVTCRYHGDFYICPDKLLTNKFGCPKCAIEKKNKAKSLEQIKAISERVRLTKEEFVKRANAKYDGKFKYVFDNEWKGVTKTVITVICPEHGEFRTLAINHIQKGNTTGCPKCGFSVRASKKTDDYDKVIEQLKQTHHNRYIYPEENRVNYKTKRDKIKILCPEHGEFIMTVQKHLCGQKCRKCATNDMINNGTLIGGYSEEIFKENPELKSKMGLLYYLKINNGKLYKIGISRTCVSDRIKSIKCKASSFGYKLKIEEFCSKEMPLYEAFQIEQEILKSYQEYRVYTKYSTELFNTDIYENIKSFF